MKTAIATALFLLVALSIPVGTAEACGGYTVSANTLGHQGPAIAISGVVTPDWPLAFYTVTLGPMESVQLNLRAASGAQVHVAYQVEAPPSLGVPGVATCGGWGAGKDSSTELTGLAPTLTLDNSASASPTTFILGVGFVSGTTSPASGVAPFVIDGSVVGAP